MIMSFLFWLSIAFLVYVYIGYPMLIAILAFLSPKREPTADDYPEVSLIIAAYNEEKVIEEKIQNTLALDYPREKLEVIIAVDGSDDDTMKIVKRFAKQGVKLSYSPERRGKMAAIIHALEKARGNILVFSDANNFFMAYTLKYLVQPFQDKRVGGTTGAKHIRKEEDSLSSSEGTYWKYESWIKRNESRFNTCTAAAGEILAVRRNLFPEKLPQVVNDDFYILLNIIKKGYRVAYVPEAESWERVSQSVQDEIKRRARITAGRFQALSNSIRWLPWNNPVAIWQIISHKYFRLFIPFAMIMALVSNIYLVFFPPQNMQIAPDFYNWLCVFQIIFYLMAALGIRMKFEGVSRILYLPAFLVNSNIAAVKGLFRFLRKKQDTRWERVNRR